MNQKFHFNYRQTHKYYSELCSRYGLGGGEGANIHDEHRIIHNIAITPLHKTYVVQRGMWMITLSVSDKERMCVRQVKQDCSRYLVARWSKSGMNSSNIAVATDRNVDYAIKPTDTKS